MDSLLRFGIVVQARLGSSRLPFKVLLPLSPGQSVLSFLVERLRHISNKLPIDAPVIVAVPNSDIKVISQSTGLNETDQLIGGSEFNVAKRLHYVCTRLGFDAIFRVTADNPFVVLEVFHLLLDFVSRVDIRGKVASLYHQKQLPNGTVVSLCSSTYLEHVAASNCTQGHEHIVIPSDAGLINDILTPEIPTSLRAPYRFCLDNEDDYRYLLTNGFPSANELDARSVYGYFANRIFTEEY